MITPTLSILTPTIPGRERQVEKLAAKIAQQTADCAGEVEHLILCDNRARTIGAKRQALLDIARGTYVAFVDDDDDISGDYVDWLLAAAATHADVLTFRQRVIYNGQEGEIEFGIKHPDEPFRPGGVAKRAPWHVCAWRREKVTGCVFGESNYGEDLIWCQQARRRVSTGYHLGVVLHTYRHDAATTAAPEPV